MKLSRIRANSVARDKRIDVGILTIVPKEVEALFRVFGIEPEHSEDCTRPLDYWEASLADRNGDDLRVVATFLSGSAGNTESALTTAYFLRDWYPRIMCLVGIAAGLEGKVRIGEVVLPDKVHDVCVTVKTEEGELPRDDTRDREELINRLLKLHPLLNDRLNSEVRALIGNELDRTESIARAMGLSHKEFSTELRVHDGSIVSGNRLLRDSGYLADVADTKDEKCRGGEMEAAGFVRACDVQHVPWLIVRAISDFGDPRKDDSFQRLAAYAAATALRLLLTQTIDFARLPHAVPPSEHESSLGATIVEELFSAYQGKRWQQTVLIGKFLSRPFWLSGKYEMRAQIGRMVEDAAAKCGDSETRASALVDDMGWTAFVLGDTESAIKHINDGLRVAREIGGNYSKSTDLLYWLSTALVSSLSVYCRCKRQGTPSAHTRIEDR